MLVQYLAASGAGVKPLMQANIALLVKRNHVGTQTPSDKRD